MAKSELHWPAPSHAVEPTSPEPSLKSELHSPTSADLAPPPAEPPPAPTHTLVTIATANKFQQLLASGGTQRRMLRISNNNVNGDSCWVFVGSGQTSKEGSYEVPPGEKYLRYAPFVPSDAIQATCASGSDTLDVEHQ